MLLLLTLAGVGQAVVGASMVPTATLLARLLLAAAGAAVPLALALAGMAGLAGALARLREEGAWLALATLGYREFWWAGLAALWALPFALAWLLCAHTVEPQARAWLRDVRSEAAASITPNETATTRVGHWAFATEAGRLHFTNGETLGYAGGWRFSPRLGGVLVELDDLQTTSDGWTVSATHATLPLALSAGPKVHISERTTPDFLRQLARSSALGRGDYERWVLWKRSLLPLALVPLCVACAGFVRRFSPTVVVGALLFGTWAGVRLLDAVVLGLGVGGTAGGFLGLLALLAVAAWRR